MNSFVLNSQMIPIIVANGRVSKLVGFGAAAASAALLLLLLRCCCCDFFSRRCVWRSYDAGLYDALFNQA